MPSFGVWVTRLVGCSSLGALGGERGQRSTGRLWGHTLDVQSRLCHLLAGDIGQDASEAGSGPSSSVKDDDDPTGIWRVEGGEIHKTHVTNACQDSEQAR